MTDAKLKSYVDRIERLEEEQRGIGSDKRDIYVEVKDAGYNTKALRKLIAERRQKDRAEIQDAMDGYRVALGMAGQAVREGMSLDDAEREYGFSRSAINRESHRQENALSGTAEGISAKDKPASIMPAPTVWQGIIQAHEEREARKIAEREAEKARRRAEREARDRRNAEIDADDLIPPPHLDRRPTLKVAA